MRLVRTTICVLIAAICSFSFAAEQIKTLTIGKWTVYRQVDAMSDQVSCVGYHATSDDIQLVKDRFYIRVRGGVDSVTLRFDDAPAKSLRLPTKMEQKVGVIIIRDSDFSEAVESKRLRFVAIKTVGGLNEGDLDLRGIQAAHEYILGGCPTPPSSKTSSKAKK